MRDCSSSKSATNTSPGNAASARGARDADDAVIVRRQSFRNGAADAAGGAGDQRHALARLLCRVMRCHLARPLGLQTEPACSIQHLRQCAKRRRGAMRIPGVACTHLSHLFEPRGVAIVGASADLTRIGGQPVRALNRFGFRGARLSGQSEIPGDRRASLLRQRCRHRRAL